jgi:hypothetical protein
VLAGISLAPLVARAAVAVAVVKIPSSVFGSSGQFAARHIQPLGPEMKVQKSAGARKGNLRPKQERRDDDIIHVSRPPRPITSCVTGLIPHIDKR